MTQLTMGNTIGRSLYHTFVYEDGTHRLAQAIIDRQSSPTTDETIGYSYDPSGRPTMVHAALADGTADTQCYRYGERSQLTQAWTPANGNCGTDPTQAGLGGPAPYWQSWTHDVAGNIVSITDRTKTTSTATTLSYPAPGSAGPHFTTSAVSTGSAPGTRTFTADPAGNTTTRANTSTPTQSLTWDPEGHLAAVTTGTGPVVTIAAYLYDADGGRLVRVEGGIATLYLGGTEISADLTDPGASASATRYYSHADRTVATRTGAAKSTVTSLFADPQNTATHSVSNTTSVLTTRRTTPYGAAPVA